MRCPHALHCSGRLRSLLACLTLLLPSVTTAAEVPQDNRPQYNRDVRPILSDKCLRCHGPDANQRKADLRLDVEDAAKESAIVAGRPDDSELIARITSDDPELRMPPAGSGKALTADEIDVLRRWIADGAAYQRHWSFIPPRRPPLPETASHGDWARGPIDRFVLARMLDQGLQPSPQADRPEWLRRVTLDLTGLPPTPQEVDDFLDDDSPEAWENVVDRLLESERYGEHMARYWLDAARYADTNGYQYDLEREQWVWRDWVIHAFNSNMPYDQFTIEQLAGDLLPGATDQQKLATGFHRNHPITIEGGVIDEEYRTEYVVDRVVTTSTVWLGLTMLCARCHDHKYDPIEQREFYRLFAFFNQVPERGLNGFNPKLQVDSPLRSAAAREVERELASAHERLRSVREAQAERLAAWERELAENAVDPWRVIVPAERKSDGTAELVVQPDQSILATGKNPEFERYELIWNVDAPIHAVRLEALTHPSLAGGSVGRAFNGNFVLSEVQLSVASGSDSRDFQPVQIASADADYQQSNYPVAAAIDGKIDRGGWAVDGNTRPKDSSAVFHLANPLQPDSTGRVRLELHHRWGGSHSLGRFRLSVATRPVSDLSAEVRTLLATPRERRSAEQADRLAEFLFARFGSDEDRAAVERVKNLRQQLANLEKAPATMVMAELEKPRPTHVLYRGEYDKPGEEVVAGTPAALPPMPAGAPSNRLGLARWIVMPDNPLTSRVTVNRFWQRLFGTGIVKTVEDFGSQGDWPSHPDLLDWLAVDFVESGWDVKALLKQIVLSATYRQSARTTEWLRNRDPDNRLLARGPSFRLDAEVIRDSALRASGLLSERVGGPSVFPYHPSGLWQEINNRPGYSRVYQQDTGDKLYRRSLYTFWKRTVPPPSMAAFDAPEREYCIVRRSRTNTPLQALVMLHDPQFVEAARHLGRRMISEGGEKVNARIEYGFLLCLARRPSEAERQLVERLVAERLRQYREDPAAAARLLDVGNSPVDSRRDHAELAAWTTAGRVLLNLSEFVTKP